MIAKDALKVSVLMVTYNHEAFIGQAIESALAQETNFDYEIVIGEDCSTDQTQEIAQEFQQRYPDRIRLLLRKNNLGGGGKENFVKTYQACQGKYIAMLEGDDYWTSPHKLQTQVDFLESHPHFSLSSHNVFIHYEDKSQPDREWLGNNHKEVLTLEDLLCYGSGGADLLLTI